MTPLTTTLLSLLPFLPLATPLIPFDSWDHGRIALPSVSLHFRYAGSGPPLLLIHGNPQHSLTWRTIGPLLAERYTVIAPDNRGAGASSIPPNDNYTAAVHAEDLSALLSFLNISSTYVFSHDKGSGFALALAIQHPTLVKRLGLSEYAFPGFGYEAAGNLAPYWDLYSNWQLAFFSVPDAAEYFIRGREKEMLQWYFYHCSYSGTEAVSEEIVDRYASAISKPGFLRPLFGPFAAKTVREDAALFREGLREKLAVPTLGLGGEACLGMITHMAYTNVSERVETDIIPKAGHWIGEFFVFFFLFSLG